jgi:hypothetical protein
MKKITFLIALFVANFSFGQTTLTPGDVAVIGVNMDVDDDFTFLLLTDIEASTEIVFTENAYISASDELRTTEGTITFTASEFMQAGSIINYLSYPNANQFVKSGTFALSGSGDQITVYQKDSNDIITFIFSVNLYNDFGYSTSKKTNSTDLPLGLNIDASNGVLTAVNLTQVDNAMLQDLSQLTGVKSDDLLYICDVSKWDTHNSSPFNLGTLSTPFKRYSFKFKVSSSNGAVSSNRGEIVAVYNTLGQKVANANLQGVYIVRVQDGAQVKAVKVLVQ